MKIRTYENSVRHGVIDTLKLEDRVKDISSQVQDSQRIVTAPALSGRRTAGENESAEAVAADNAVNGAKSFAGAFRDFAGNEIKRALKRAPVRTDAANAMRRAVSTGGRTPRGDLNRRTLRVIKGNAGQTVKSHAAGQAVSGAAVRGVEKTAVQGVRIAAQTTAAAGTAAKTAVSAGAGAATAGTSTAVQAAAEAAKKAAVGPVKMMQESAAAASRASPLQAADMARAAQTAQEAAESFGEKAQPKGWTKFAFAIAGITLTLYMMLAGVMTSTGYGRAVNLNERVESYRPSVQKWAAKFGIPEYVEVLLALCMAETGILENPGDPFACSESGLAVKQPDGITDPEYSIEIGVYCFSLKVKKAKCASPADRNGLFKALQAYNMGDGFIDFCDTYYGGIWSVECAQAFSDKMGQGRVYGNPNYIEQFLRCYEFGTVTSTPDFSGALNAAGLCWPLGDAGQDSITQHFGGMYSGEPHKGLDIGMPEGTPIYAAADGEVIIANDYDSWGYSWGYYVKINHSSLHDTLYAHMSRVAVREGQYVRQGELIGYVGNTGNSSGPHLHFELYLNGTRVDPEPYIGTDALQKYLLTNA